MDSEKCRELVRKPSWLWTLIGTHAAGTRKVSGGVEFWICSYPRGNRLFTFTIGKLVRSTMTMRISERSTVWQLSLITRKRQRSIARTSTWTFTKLSAERITETILTSLELGGGDGSKQWRQLRSSHSIPSSSADGVRFQKKRADLVRSEQRGISSPGPSGTMVDGAWQTF